MVMSMPITSLGRGIASRFIYPSWRPPFYVVLTMVLVLGLAGGQSLRLAAESPAEGGTDVRGVIEGTEVHLDAAEMDQQLAIFAGDSWAFNPSLLMFLFLDENEQPDGRTFEYSAEGDEQFNRPHIHARYRAGDSGDIETVMLMSDYDMTLRFGEREGNVLPGSIELKHAEHGIEVSGDFRATIK